jgi:hypothetical protein
MHSGLEEYRGLLDQAEHHASAKQFDVGVLMTSPDFSHWGSGERVSRRRSVVGMMRMLECQEAVGLGRA